MSKESESYRLEMLRRLEEKYSKSKPSEVFEAEQVIAKYRDEQETARAAIPRLRSPLPEPNLCPQCWFLHGRRTSLTAGMGSCGWTKQTARQVAAILILQGKPENYVIPPHY